VVRIIKYPHNVYYVILLSFSSARSNLIKSTAAVQYEHRNTILYYYNIVCRFLCRRSQTAILKYYWTHLVLMIRSNYNIGHRRINWSSSADKCTLFVSVPHVFNNYFIIIVLNTCNVWEFIIQIANVRYILLIWI